MKEPQLSFPRLQMDDGGCLFYALDVERVDKRRRYELVLHAHPGEKAESRLLPGFQIDVGQLLAECPLHFRRFLSKRWSRSAQN